MSNRQTEAELLIGAHAQGGISGALKSAKAIGANTIQIFIGSPQTWKPPSPKHDEIANFYAQAQTTLGGPTFVHGNYLVNLASSTAEHRQKSIDNLKRALHLSDQIGADGLIFHPGSAGSTEYKQALKIFLKALEEVLEAYIGKCKLLLEVAAGQGHAIGTHFSQFREVLSHMGNDSRLGVCWDTCHLFAAGYDIASEEGLKSTVEEFEKEIGFDQLYAIHANDSKGPLGCRKDRHENIGLGHIGEAAFRRMLHHPRLRYLPWILEVPGFDNKGPDKQNIDILKRLALEKASEAKPKAGAARSLTA
jgi:apurinic endonuclease APN1